MRVNRNIVTVLKKAEENIQPKVNLSPKEAFSFVWELTQEIYSLNGKFDAKSRLQRDVVRLTRRES